MFRRDQQPLLLRRRTQLIGALMIAALLPWVARVLEMGKLNEAAVTNALIGNAIAVTIALWMRLSVEPYPGIRRSVMILPAALGSHAAVLAWFVFTRFPYDRIGLMAGLVLHVIWLYFLYIKAERSVVTRIAVVPFGGAESLLDIRTVEWLRMKRPHLRDTRRCDAIVADFDHLPDAWEAFLADAALAGRVVYQHKQLRESLTGRIELERLSENSFGALVPVRAYFYIKSAADFVLALLVLPIALPIVAIAAVAILLDDGGPVLFKQKRLGHAGNPFMAYKFRTMRSLPKERDKQELLGALATEPDDDRITSVGAVLRRYRIDELPQIFNILKGDMSWIGPRPEPEALTHWFISEIPFYRYRHVVKPGISGWAQVNQGYVSGVEGISVKLQYDFYYIKNFSLWLDVLILFRTLATLFNGFGAR